jgi:hypothetical protein
VATSPPPHREVSLELFSAVKAASRDRPAYKLGREVGLDPPQLSRILRDQVRPAEEARVLALAAKVGVPADRAFARRRPERGGR